MMKRSVTLSLPVLAVVTVLGGCSFEMEGFVNDKSASTRVTLPPEPAPTAAPSGPLVDENGVCRMPEASLGPKPAKVELGASECDVVRIEGKPDDVLIGSSSQANRETQLLYARPGAKLIYLFADGKLKQIVN